MKPLVTWISALNKDSRIFDGKSLLREGAEIPKDERKSGFGELKVSHHTSKPETLSAPEEAIFLVLSSLLSWRFLVFGPLCLAVI